MAVGCRRLTDTTRGHPVCSVMAVGCCCCLYQLPPNRCICDCCCCNDSAAASAPRRSPGPALAFHRKFQVLLTGIICSRTLYLSVQSRVWGSGVHTHH